MISLHELQWMSRCLTHSGKDATEISIIVMDMFKKYPALINRYQYLYVMASKKSIR